MTPKTTYAVFYKTVPELRRDWQQYDEWTEDIEKARSSLAQAEKNSRFAECKIVERTETFDDFDGESRTLVIDNKALDDIIVCAVRYACGRRTYMPGIVVTFTKTLVKNLETNTLRVICSDILSAVVSGNGLGDPSIDAPLWDDLYRVCKKELNRREAITK